MNDIKGFVYTEEKDHYLLVLDPGLQASLRPYDIGAFWLAVNQ